MSLLDAARYRLRVLLHPEAHATQLDEEMRFHLDLETMQRAHGERGGDPRAARWGARRRFGNVTRHKEETRQMAGLSWIDVVRQDLRFALRSFRRTPAFTAVAVLTLALGIGANTAIFSAVDAMLLRPLPFRDPGRLMKVSLTFGASGGRPAGDDVVWSYPKSVVFRQAQRSYSDATLWGSDESTIRSGGDAAERVKTEVVDAHYLATLGLRPELGRDFAPDEDARPGGPPVVLIGDALWKRRFDGRASAIGRTLDVDGKPATIVGVLPPGFQGLSGSAELLVPLLSLAPQYYNQAWSHSYVMVARLAPGVAPEQARAEARALGKVVAAAYPPPDGAANRDWGATARPLDATRVDPVIRRSLLVLFGAVGLVLLIACANVANLFLLRAAGRRREIAVRLAVGAGRRRLVRQLLTESVTLGVLGGLASVFVAWLGTRALAAMRPAAAARLQESDGLGAVGFDSIHLDPRALVFAAALAVGTGLVFGLVPALQVTRPSLTDALKDTGAPAPHARRRRLAGRNVLAAAEIALALVLLAGSGLMLRSLGKLLGVSQGFEPRGVLTARFSLGDDTDPAKLPAFYDALLDRVAAIPGVTQAGMTACPPLNGGCNLTMISLRDRPAPAPGTEPLVGVHWVTPSWFGAAGVPVLRGRAFTRDDRVGGRKVVLVSETAARRFWPNDDPIGRGVSVGQGGFSDDTAYVVGVVGDLRYDDAESPPVPDVYLSYYQSPRPHGMLFVRGNGDAGALAAPLRRALHDVAPAVPMFDVQTMDARVADALSSTRFSALLLALFAAMALALATLGTYGVVSYAVSQRTREIGVRVALGATRGDVVRGVVRHGATLVGAGAAVGLVGAVAATRVLASLLYGVEPTDPVTFVAITAVLGAAVLAASWLPARRAAGIDPVEALRE